MKPNLTTNSEKIYPKKICDIFSSLTINDKQSHYELSLGGDFHCDTPIKIKLGRMPVEESEAFTNSFDEMERETDTSKTRVVFGDEIDEIINSGKKFNPFYFINIMDRFVRPIENNVLYFSGYDMIFTGIVIYQDNTNGTLYLQVEKSPLVTDLGSLVTSKKAMFCIPNDEIFTIGDQAPREGEALNKNE